MALGSSNGQITNPVIKLPAGRYWYQYDAWVGSFTGNQSNFAESDQICAYYLSHEMV